MTSVEVNVYCILQNGGGELLAILAIWLYCKGGHGDGGIRTQLMVIIIL